VFFAQPVDKPPLAALPSGSASFTFPKSFAGLVMFGITAYNPRGQNRAHSLNVAANLVLRADLSTVVPAPRFVASSFGFSRAWRENGFTVAFAPNDEVAAQAALMALAVKHEQGAIYKYTPGDHVGVLRRQTVPAVMQNVEADLWVVPCAKPDLSTAEVDWVGSE
jgi:hypothetical protein